LSINKSLALFICLLLLSVLTIFFSLASGSIEISLSQFWSALTGSGQGLENQVLRELRIPRTFAAFVTGGLLAFSGVVMQVLLRNPLADPYILGISGGAAVAALTTILIGISNAWIPYAAFIGAVFSITLVFGITNSGGSWSVTRLILTGVVVSAGWGAIINILLTTSSTNTVQSMLFWLMGDLSQSRIASWHFIVLILGIAVGIFYARSLNVLIRGELQAQSLGVNVAKLRIVLYLTASVLTATAVTIAGSVGFVGLIIPHMLRLLGARDHRLLIPFSVLLGGSFLVMADSFARTIIAPQQLPAGVVTAVIGVPVFLVILRSTVTQRK
jgi:iron complex transport system permease protein